MKKYLSLDSLYLRDTAQCSPINSCVMQLQQKRLNREDSLCKKCSFGKVENEIQFFVWIVDMMIKVRNILMMQKF